MIEIVNVVGGGDLYREIDLDNVVEDISTYSVDRKVNGLYIKIEEDSPLIILYTSGKYVITGARNLVELRLAYNQLIELFSEIGLEDVKPSFNIYNIVHKCDFGRSYDLEKLQLVFGFEQTEYEPEQSPFLVYRPDAYDCVITISSSGKSVINGVTSPSIAEDVFKYVKSHLDGELT